MKQEIIGLQRVLENTQQGSKWNNKRIKWSIVHNYNNQTKPYDIQLQMVLISSKRILKVNDQIKDTQMCSFGYESHFDISDRLKGHIKQDSLTFQLYINGNSFTKLQQQNKTYQPPKLKIQQKPIFDIKTVPTNNISNQKKKLEFKEFNEQIPSNKLNGFPGTLNKAIQKIQTQNNLTKSTSFKKQQIFQQLPLKHKPMSYQVKQVKNSTQNTLKDAQSQLMKILMQQKKRKKQTQQQKL